LTAPASPLLVCLQDVSVTTICASIYSRSRIGRSGINILCSPVQPLQTARARLGVRFCIARTATMGLFSIDLLVCQRPTSILVGINPCTADRRYGVLREDQPSPGPVGAGSDDLQPELSTAVPQTAQPPYPPPACLHSAQNSRSLWQSAMHSFAACITLGPPTRESGLVVAKEQRRRKRTARAASLADRSRSFPPKSSD
jgi:hypothetical protein